MSIQKNVQAQNDQTLATIRAAALRFANNRTAFAWLANLLVAKGLHPDQGLLVNLSEVPEQGGNLVQGTWLTAEGSFYAFAAMVSRIDGKMLELDHFNDITGTTPVGAHERGIGRTFGSLALDVMREMLGTQR